jgi:hypothetical protein
MFRCRVVFFTREIQMTENQPFDCWAVVEVMGHSRYAGRVTEQSGTVTIRTLRDVLAVPASDGWVPQRGDWVVVPSKALDKSVGYSAVVERVCGDMVHVRVPVFRWGRPPDYSMIGGEK